MAKGNRTGKGQFAKGKSGNPRGRPKKDYDAQALVAKLTHDGADIVKFWRSTLDEPTIIDDETGRVVSGPSWTDKLNANARLAERLWGKPPEHLKASIEHTGKDGGPQQHEHEHTVYLELPD